MLVLAQAQQAPKDLATLIQAGQTKPALEQIQAGADVNRAQADGTTPLIWAVDRTDYEIAEALIAKKANPNAVNEFGVTPLTSKPPANPTRVWSRCCLTPGRRSIPRIRTVRRR